MPYKCPTWDWQSDGYKKGPRHAPMLESRFHLAGLLRREEVHASLQSHLRLMLVTYLAARGPTETPSLARALGSTMGCIGTKLRGMRSGWLVDCIRVHQDGVKRIGCWPREWWATETGRWALWRQAWLTRSAIVSPEIAWDIHTPVPDDPVDAVRFYASEEFLRPGSYRAAAYLVQAGSATMGEVATALELPSAVIIKRLKRWERKGLLERGELPVPGLPGPPVWSRRFTEPGIQALLCHVDALRKAGLACGWSPTPGAVTYRDGGNEYRYEEEFLRNGWTL